jgi:hypothetical protein
MRTGCQNAERKIHIRMEEDLHRRQRILRAELDTTIQDFVVELLWRTEIAESFCVDQ